MKCGLQGSGRAVTTVEILTKAKAELERRGWIQGDFAPMLGEADKVPCCMAGAVRAALTGDPRKASFGADDAFTCLEKAAGVVASGGVSVVSTIGEWNDRPGRTLDEVLATFDSAIALASQPQGTW